MRSQTMTSDDGTHHCLTWKVYVVVNGVNNLAFWVFKSRTADQFGGNNKTSKNRNRLGISVFNN